MHSFQLRSIAVADSAWKYSHSQLISSHWKDNSTICIRSRKINVVQRTNNIGIFALHSAVCNVQCSAMCNAIQYKYCIVPFWELDSFLRKVGQKWWASVTKENLISMHTWSWKPVMVWCSCMLQVFSHVTISALVQVLLIDQNSRTWTKCTTCILSSLK